MKIGIELLADEIGKSGCITFHRKLIYWLSKLAKDEIYYVFAYSREYDDYMQYNQNHDKLRLINLGRRKSLLIRILDQQFKIPRLLKTYGITRVYSDNTVPFWTNDIKYFFEVLITQQFHPEYPDKYFRRLFRIITTKYACRVAEIVIVNSNYTKSEVIKYCKIKENKIVLINEAADLEQFSSITDKISLKKYLLDKYGISGDFILQVSGLYDHKNPIVSIRTLGLLKKKGCNLELVLAGIDTLNNWPRYQEIAKELNIAENVHYVGFLMPEEVNKFYNTAICLLYPSYSETFGIPPLEAMACGTPVIGSDKSAVPEIISGGGIIVDTNDLENIALIIIKLLNEPEFRQSIIKQGYLRLSEFSWEKTITLIKRNILI
jgi:glycosyltransferase involved in cell wall biosynthesis